MTTPLTLNELAEIDVSRIPTCRSQPTPFEAVGCHNVLDLLSRYPRPDKISDRRKLTKIEDLTPGTPATVLAVVKEAFVAQTRSKTKYGRVNIYDETGAATLAFWNQAWIVRELRAGQQIVIHGTPERRKQIEFQSPLIDTFGTRTGRLAQFYDQSPVNDLSSGTIEQAIVEALDRIEHRGFLDPLANDLDTFGIISRDDAYREIHQPSSIEMFRAARRRLAVDEAVRLQVATALRRERDNNDVPGISHGEPPAVNLADMLGYTLTNGQYQAMQLIDELMASVHPMNLLLQGDVGCGKTLVAAHAICRAVANGSQAVLVAPTQILAEQHHADLAPMLESAGMRVELVVGASRTKARQKVIDAVADGHVNVVIGTHGIVGDKFTYNQLGLVVTDEQHRFGAEVRDAAVYQDGHRADSLTMSATPIPRSLALTVYGHLQNCAIRELPAGRTPTTSTAIAGQGNWKQAWSAIREAVNAGRQAFVVCPLVNKSETAQANAAIDVAERLGKNSLQGLRLGVVHGKMKPSERNEVMAQMSRGELDVLVASTVIEVGVNVPNASVMAIVDADSFGIAQLHQIRGRVGRGQHPGQCFFLTSEPSDRVDIVASTTDGFELAEADLKLRGEGDITGSAQSGRGALSLVDVREDEGLIAATHDFASQIVTEDPTLTNYPGLAEEAQLFFPNLFHENRIPPHSPPQEQ